MSSYREIRPGPRLARYVECYWHREDGDGTSHHRVLPDGCVDLLFARRCDEPVSLSVVGLMTAPHVLDIAQGQFFFGVRFRPGMAAAFVPGAASLNNQTVPIEDLMGSFGKTLFERFSESSGPEQMATISESLLRPLEPPDDADRFLTSLTQSDTSLDRLISQSGKSARHLRRESLRRTGVSPKFLSRIVRFRRAVDRMHSIASAKAEPGWAGFAVSCGYFDQAHFIREFQEFAGCTPGRFIQSIQKDLR